MNAKGNKVVHLLLRPSVMTSSQSFVKDVRGHFHRAPDLVVFGCLFLSSGAPTNNL